MELSRIFPVRLQELVRLYLKEENQIHTDAMGEIEDSLEEIRVRIGQPLEFIYGNTVRWLPREETRINREDITEMLNYISKYSLYAYREEMRQGFVTINGGHRIGLAGHVVMEKNAVAGMTPVTFLNIRVAHERKGCAGKLLPYLRQGNTIYHTLLFSPPGIGKTTCLRDLVRMISDGAGQEPGMKVGLVDERSELAACEKGCPQNDIGKRTDVLDNCGKPAGIEVLLRVMSPQVIAVDELGTREDFTAVRAAAVSGCRVLATAHGGTMEELEEKQYLSQRVFERFVLLSKSGEGRRCYEIYDGSKRCLCRIS